MRRDRSWLVTLPRRRGTRFLLFGALALLAGAPGAGATPAPTPPWLGATGSTFGIATTGDWRVSVPGQNTTGPRAKVVNVISPGIPKSSDALGRQGMIEIWAPTCTKEKQTIRLEREVVLPGPVGKVAVSINTLTAPGFSIVSAELLVNGRSVVTVGPRGGGFELTEGKGRVFGFGENTIEIVATKAPNPAGVAACNTSKATKVAIQAHIRGEFATDLALIEPSPANDAYDAAHTNSIAGQVSFTVRNKGPGGAARGRFYFTFAIPPTPDVRVLDISVPSGGPFEQCKTGQQQGSTAYQGSCEFSDFRAGTSAVIRMRYGAGGVKKGADASVSIRWGIYMEGTDLKPDNNERLVTLWFCNVAVADDGKSCKPAA